MTGNNTEQEKNKSQEEKIGEKTVEKDLSAHIEKRLSSLIGKLKEKDELVKIMEEEKTKLAQEVKEKEFEAKFYQAVLKYPQAGELKDKVKEKYLKGIDLEDAIILELHKADKLNTNRQPSGQGNLVGGSMSNPPNVFQGQGSKKPSEMTEEELLKGLMEAEKKGEIGVEFTRRR